MTLYYDDLVETLVDADGVQVPTYYAIVAFGLPSYGKRRSYYQSRKSAIWDAQMLGGGSLQSVRVVACPSIAEAKDADISESWPVVCHI